MSDGVWREKHILPEGEHALEVGILTNEKPDEEEELKYSGFLTQVGKDAKPCESLASGDDNNNNNKLIISPSYCALLLPLQAPSSSPKLDLHDLLRQTNRPTSYPAHQPPQPLSPHHPTQGHMRAAHLPHPTKYPFYRALPPLRHPHTTQPQPARPALPQRRHRPRSTLLPHAAMGLSSPLRDRHLRRVGEGLDQVRCHDSTASAIHDTQRERDAGYVCA